MLKKYKNNQKKAGNRPPGATLSELRSHNNGNDHDGGQLVCHFVT